MSVKSKHAGAKPKTWRDVISTRSSQADFFVRRGYWDMIESIVQDNCRRHTREMVTGWLSSCGNVDTYEILDSEVWRNRLVIQVGSPGLWINGASAVRLIIHELGLVQPEELLKDEKEQPDIQKLVRRAKRERTDDSRFASSVI